MSDGMKEGHLIPGIASKTIFRWIAAWFLDIIGVTFDTVFLRIALISTQEKVDARYQLNMCEGLRDVVIGPPFVPS